ncbi:MAG TPA: glycosyltransferase family 4 protein [Desulfonatronum sp.]|nr:glycosyltransferase family 4 protein [Desulfonatronum sp.]
MPLLAALGFSWGLTAYLSGTRAKLRILDHPNERSLHQAPVPRTGGLAILAGLAAALLLISGLNHFPHGLVWPLTGAVLVALISFCDDRAGVGVIPRFAMHGLAAIIALSAGLGLGSLEVGVWTWQWPGVLGLIISLLFLIWMTNLYNFMDGMDGFAGGMGLIGFCFLGLFGWLSGNAGYGLVCFSAALACAGFLVFNFPPARIFMGDTGASTLGFLAAILILFADLQELFPFWAGVLVFSPFIVDATVTLLRRLVAGERLWQAHRNHYYQRLVQLGWGHKKTVLAEYAVMLATGTSALILLRAGKTLFVPCGLFMWAAVYAALGAAIRRLELRRNAGKH